MTGRQAIAEWLIAGIGGLFLISVLVLTGPPTDEEVPTTVVTGVLFAQALFDGIVPFWTSNLGFGLALPFSETFNYHPLVLLFGFFDPYTAVALILWFHGTIGIYFFRLLCRELDFERQAANVLTASFVLSVPMLRVFWELFWPSTVVAWTMLPVLLYLSLRFFASTERLEILRASLVLGLVAGLTGLSAHLSSLTIYVLPLAVVWLVHWRHWVAKVGYVGLAVGGAAALIQVRLLPLAIYFREFPEGLSRFDVQTSFLGDFVWGMMFRPLVWPPWENFFALLANQQLPEAMATLFDHYLMRHLDVQTSFLGPVLLLLSVVAIVSRAIDHPYRRALALAAAFATIAMIVPPSVSGYIFNIRFIWADGITFLLLLLAGITLSALAQEFGAKGRHLAMVSRRALIIVLAVGIFPNVFLASSLILSAEDGLASKPYEGLPKRGRHMVGVANLREMANSPLASKIKKITGLTSPRVYLSTGVEFLPLTGLAGGSPARAVVPMRNGLALSGLRVVNSFSKGFTQGSFYPEYALPYSTITAQDTLLSRPAALDVLGINVVAAFPDELEDESLILKQWISLADGRRFGIYRNSDAWESATVVSPRIEFLELNLVPNCEHQRLLCRDFSQVLNLAYVKTRIKANYSGGNIHLTLGPGDEERTLFVTEAYRPGWLAISDTGEQLAVSPALGAFMAVRVPGQVKTISLSYRPTWRERSFMVFAVSLIALLSVLLGVTLYGRHVTVR